MTGTQFFTAHDSIEDYKGNVTVTLDEAGIEEPSADIVVLSEPFSVLAHTSFVSPAAGGWQVSTNSHGNHAFWRGAVWNIIAVGYQEDKMQITLSEQPCTEQSINMQATGEKGGVLVTFAKNEDGEPIIGITIDSGGEKTSVSTSMKRLLENE